MNTKSLLLVFILLLLASSVSLSSQTLVSVKNSITQDTLLTIIQSNSISSKTVIASGQAVFSSKTGYVRILLSDDYGYDLLVYESSPLISVNGVDNFSNEAIETVDIPVHLALTKVRVEIKNAELRNLSVDISTLSSFRTQQQTRADRIALINSNLRNQNALWVAGETPIAQMSFEEKKEFIKSKVSTYWQRNITVLSGGTLILDGGTIESGCITAESGSNFNIINDGKIYLKEQASFNIDSGANFYMDSGLIE